MAFITIGLRNTTVVDYTTDLSKMVAAINALSLNPPPKSNLSEGILDISKAIEKRTRRASGYRRRRGLRRAVGRGVRERGAQSATPERRDDECVSIATNQAMRGVGALADESNREQVLGDGAKQSGGRRVEVTGDDRGPEGPAADRRRPRAPST